MRPPRHPRRRLREESRQPQIGHHDHHAEQQRDGVEVDRAIRVVQSQRAGASQPHSPKVCLPASGWTPESTGELTISTPAGAITVNRYVVASRGERAVVLYWYQTSRRAIAGEWSSKLWLVADAFRDRRTDTALVRIVVESQPGSDDRATGTAADFARFVYPVLRDELPR